MILGDTAFILEDFIDIQRINSGYLIINQIKVGEIEIVLDVHHKLPNSFVTWKCKNGDYYYWGNYHTSLLSAQKDFCKRALSEIRNIEQIYKKQKQIENERLRHD